MTDRKPEAGLRERMREFRWKGRWEGNDWTNEAVMEFVQAELAAARNTPEEEKCESEKVGSGCASTVGTQTNAPAGNDAKTLNVSDLFSRHLSAVEQFLQEMYATMIDPCEQPKLKVPEMMAILLNAARESREAAARNTPEIARELRNIAKAIEVGWDSSNWRRPQIPRRVTNNCEQVGGGAVSKPEAGCGCGHIACVCNIQRRHKSFCKFRIAATGPIGIECEHGWDVCPICDPCTCGKNVGVSDFAPLELT